MFKGNTLLAGAAVAALTLGVTGQIKGNSDREVPLSKSDIVVVTDDSAPTAGQTEENAQESAKMGKEEGTHQGKVGAAPESDTKKVEQPSRQNPTTSGGAMDNKGTDTNTGE